MLTYKVKIYMTDNEWTASVDWEGERLFGRAASPALAIVELGFYWEKRSRDSDSDLKTLAKLMVK